MVHMMLGRLVWVGTGHDGEHAGSVICHCSRFAPWKVLTTREAIRRLWVNTRSGPGGLALRRVVGCAHDVVLGVRCVHGVVLGVRCVHGVVLGVRCVHGVVLGVRCVHVLFPLAKTCS